jgi:tetratricopeptide (TPR) repeat protein
VPDLPRFRPGTAAGEIPDVTTHRSGTLARALLLICAGYFLGVTPAMAQHATAPEAIAAMRPEAYYEFLLGSHLEGEGDVAKAIAAYQRAATLDPAAAAIPAELAGLYARQGRLTDARTSAEAALKLDPKNVDAHRVLGSIYASVVESSDEAKATGATADAARQAVVHLEQGRRQDGTDQDAGLDLALAKLYMRLGDNQKAADILSRVIEYEPDAGESYVLLARAQSALGSPEKAMAALEEASSSNPRLLGTLGQLYEDQRKWADAARTYEKLSRFDPDSTEVKTRWAAALLQSDDSDAATKARDLLVQVNAAAPTEARPLYLLSVAERKRRDFAAAEKAARQLMSLDPGGSSGAFALAQVYEEQHLYPKAAETLAPVVARLDRPGQDPGRDVLTLLAHLGYVQLQAGLGTDAVKTFERARELTKGAGSFDSSLIQAYLTARQFDKAADLAHAARLRQPDQPRYAELEARALSQSGRKDRAVIVLRDAATAHPQDISTHLSLAQILQDAGRAGEADQVLDEAAKKFPSDVRVPFERGALLERRKDYVRAESAFRDALSRDPLHAPSLNYLGYMLAERGERLDEAVTLVERALAIDPDNGSYLDSLGWAYVRQKRYDKAEPLLTRAAAQLPGNSVVQDHLGDLLWAMGRRSDAARAWQRALDGDRDELDVKAVERKLSRAR